MSNPWENVNLSDYENHMKLDSVMQLQTINQLMNEQFNSYPVTNVMVLGIAGGNGLEHIETDKYKKVYGVDVNCEYLNMVRTRYQNLSEVLELLHKDLTKESNLLPTSEFIVANLLIEYIGYDAFRKTVLTVKPKYVSTIIQINSDEDVWVSESPYIHVFDELDTIHYPIREDKLITVMDEIGYNFINNKPISLPNGKRLVKIDFKR